MSPFDLSEEPDTDGGEDRYAAVAVLNFLSTTCQYEALKYVS